MTWKPSIVKQAPAQDPAEPYVVTLSEYRGTTMVQRFGIGEVGSHFPNADQAVAFLERKLTELFAAGHVIHFDNTNHGDLEKALAAIKAKPLAEDVKSPDWKP